MTAEKMRKKLRKGYISLPLRMHDECRSMVVRVTDDQQKLVCTGIAIGSHGVIVTSGHAIQEHLTSNNKTANDDPSLYVQFLDGGIFPVSKIYDYKFNRDQGLDFALIHADHGKLLPLLHTSYKYDLTGKKFRMWGYSPFISNGTYIHQVSGTHTGPLISIGGHSILLGARVGDGNYDGFSGAAQFMYHSAYGLEFSGIQSGQLTDFSGSLVFMPTLKLRDTSPPTIQLRFLSYKEREKEEGIFSRFAFVCDIITKSKSPADKAHEILAAIARYAPLLERQLPATKAARLIEESFSSSANEKYIAVAISHRRPRRIEKRKSLASAFHRQAWTRNMLRPMTAHDLLRITEFREDVVIFKILGE